MLLIIMRSFIFLLCTTVFSLNVSTTFSQETVFIEKDETLTVNEVFEMVGQQTDYRFIYPQELFKDAPEINVKRGVMRAHDLIIQTLSYKNLTYELTPENTIVLKQVTSRDFQSNITGVVIDENGVPLAGVNIIEKGTNNGVVSNFDGQFNISVSSTKSVLIVSYVSYKTQEILVGDQITFEIKMIPATNQLEEVVVTGYQQISKERSVGSYAKPDMEAFSNRSTSMNLIQRLDGLVPGLVLNSTPKSNGSPKANILIRGLSTIKGSLNPLFVVDGMILQDISSINPQDIADVTVLKDATSASIYGARASNGVIVITTKKGGFNQSITVNYNTFVSMQGKPDIRYRPVLSSEQFIETAQELFDPVQFPYSRYSTFGSNMSTSSGKSISVHNQILYDLDNGTIDQATADERLAQLASMNNIDQIEDLLYRNSILSNHTISVQGGSRKHAFYGSLAYTNDVGSSPGQRTQTFKLNVRQDFKVSKRIQFRLNTDLTKLESESKRAIGANNLFTPYAMFRDQNGNNLSMGSVQHFSPALRQTLEDVSGISLDYVPLDEVNYGSSDGKSLSARLTGGIDVDIWDGLKFEGVYGYFQENTRGTSFDDEKSYGVRSDVVFFTESGANPGDPVTYHLPAQGGNYSTSDVLSRSWTIRNQFSYDQAWNDNQHQVTLLGGFEAQEQLSTVNSTFIRGYDPRTQLFPFLDYPALNSGISGTIVRNSRWNSSLNLRDEPFGESEALTRVRSFYANGSYTLNGKYTFNGSWRIDESNLFGIAKSAQNRPVWSAGAKWLISNENFLNGSDWIDQLALRTTYGITGNSPAPGGATSFDVLRTSAAYNVLYTADFANDIISPGNKKLSWEQTKNLNIGIDFSFLERTISGSFNYYRNKTEDLIDRFVTNTFTGFPSIPGNAGTLENKGIELNLNTRNIKGEFTWNTGLVLSHNENEITSLNSNLNALLFDVIAQGYPRKGFPGFAIFAYDFAGLNDEGSPQIQLQDGSIVSERNIATFDDVKFMGTYQPKWSGGFTNTFGYKGFTLRAHAIFNLGHVMFVDRPSRWAFSGLPLEGGIGSFTSGNVHADFYNRWKQPGDENSTDIPAYLAQSNSVDRDLNYFFRGDHNVQSASYIKLRDITLSYELPTALIEKINVSRANIRVQMNNVMLWKKNDRGIDPEFHSASTGTRLTPSNQNAFTFGVNLSF